MRWLEMKKIRDEKLQYDINKEGAKMLALSSGKIDKYEDIHKSKNFKQEYFAKKNLLLKHFSVESNGKLIILGKLN